LRTSIRTRLTRPAAFVALLLSAAAIEARAQDTTSAHRDSAAAHADTSHAPPADTTKPSRPTRICAGGDVTLGTNLDTAWARSSARRMRAEHGLSVDPDSLIQPLRPFFSDADIVLVNNEMAIGSGRSESKCGRHSKHCFAFRAPPSAAHAVRSLGDSDAVVVANVANNHSHDAGGTGLDSTRALLNRERVLVTGTDTLATPVVLADGSTIAFLGFHTSEDAPDARDLDAVSRHVARAVAMYGTVIVTAHLGAEGASRQRTFNATELFLETQLDRGNPVAFAHTALDAGATAVIMHGPHVMRAGEWRDDRLVLYSLGNLLTYGPFNLEEPLNRGVVACVDVSGRSVVRAELRPTMQIAPGILTADTARRAITIIDSLSVLDFPTTGVRADSLGVIVPRADSTRLKTLVAPDSAR
jgi:hypothetical protein